MLDIHQPYALFNQFSYGMVNNGELQMRILFILLIGLMLTACGESPTGSHRTIISMENVCTIETNDVRSKFILGCIKGANPLSDEEPEDWLHICGELAERTYCPARSMELTQICKYSEFTNCSYWLTESMTEIDDEK